MDHDRQRQRIDAHRPSFADRGRQVNATTIGRRGRPRRRGRLFQLDTTAPLTVPEIDPATVTGGECAAVREVRMSMRIVAWGVAAAAAIALGSAVSAQNVPSTFVVSGKAAEQIQDFTTINLATAERIAETCERLAAAQGVAVTVMVLDNDGNHVYMAAWTGRAISISSPPK